MIQSISDGTSNTLGVAETAGGLVFIGTANEGWAQNPIGHSYFAANFGACPRSSNPNCAPNAVSPANTNTTATHGRGMGFGLPGALHGSSRYNAVFMDGSVRFLDGNMQRVVYVPICGATDGDVFSFD